jgi:hypothetical protein
MRLTALAACVVAVVDGYSIGAVHAVQPRRGQQIYPCTTNFGAGVHYDLTSLADMMLFFAGDSRNNVNTNDPVYDFYYAVCHDISKSCTFECLVLRTVVLCAQVVVCFLALQAHSTFLVARTLPFKLPLRGWFVPRTAL